MRRFLLFCLWVAMAYGMLALAGCAAAPSAGPVLVPTPIPCPAAQDVLVEPSRNLQLDATKPGEAVQAYAANRARWIGYSDALRSRLEACK
jgi:hypothetical protein